MRERESGGVSRCSANKTHRPSTTERLAYERHSGEAVFRTQLARSFRGAAAVEEEEEEGEAHGARAGQDPSTFPRVSLAALQAGYPDVDFDQLRETPPRTREEAERDFAAAEKGRAVGGQTAAADGRKPAPVCVSLAAEGRCAPRRASARAAGQRAASPPAGGGHPPRYAQGGPFCSPAGRLPRHRYRCERDSWLDRLAAWWAVASSMRSAGRSRRARRPAFASARRCRSTAPQDCACRR